jgi:hypothetical protein
MVIISLSASSRARLRREEPPCDELFVPERFEVAAEIIDITKEFAYTHGWGSVFTTRLVSAPIVQRKIEPRIPN